MGTDRALRDGPARTALGRGRARGNGARDRLFGDRARLVAVVLLAVPVMFVLWQGWSQRWMADDGFINIRVLDQLFAGNGPVFNAGERIEAATSPAWLYLLGLGRVVLFFLPIEWVAVILGLAMTVGGVVIAQVAGIELVRRRAVLPFGMLAFVVLPPVADFATSGLETGLTFLWIASAQLFLVRAVERATPRATYGAAVVIGLGPLVRPDLAVMTLVWFAVLAWLCGGSSWLGLLRLGGAALALPGLYEVFRAGYYGALLPNTAFAKEASSSNWGQGWLYLRDLVGTYHLWVALALLAVGAALLWRVLEPDRRLVAAAPIVAGLVHGFFVVRGGGDFMHGRLLLPAVFAIATGIAVVPMTRAFGVVAAAMAAWAVVPLVVGGPPYDAIGPDHITDERSLETGFVPNPNPVTIDDYAEAPLAAFGSSAATGAASGARELMLFNPAQGGTAVPLAEGNGEDYVFAIGAIGMMSVAAGTDVYVLDALGLADPIGARLELLTRARPAHEKVLPEAWMVARFAGPGAEVPGRVDGTDVAAARQALECDDLAELIARTRDDLTPGRFFANIGSAFRLHGLRVHPDPVIEARRCA